MLIKRIHMNRQHLVQNKKLPKEQRKPVLTVKTSKSNTYGNEVEILGKSKLVYRPEKPLSCGAVAWIETRGKVVVNGRIIIE